MKIKIWLYLFLMILSVSCVDLESKQSWLITDDEFPVNERDAETLVAAAAYGAFNAYWGSGFSAGENGWHVISDMCTDILCCKWTDSRFLPLNSVNFTPNTNACTRFYREKIAQLGVATLTYDRIAHVPMSEETRTRMFAEMHCGQGWLAYLLFDLYGGLQIPDLETLQNPLKNIIVPRKSHDETVAYIEENIRWALDSGALALNYTGSDPDYGRFTQGLCHMVLLKLYMHERRWPEAEVEARELMDPKYGYDLMEHYKDIFTLENEGNCEIIKAVTCNRNTPAATQMWLSQVLPAVYPTKNASITKWDGYRVLWEFYNTFDPAIDETGRRKDERLEVLVGEFTGTDGVLYNEEHPGSPLDKGALPIKIGEDPNDTGDGSDVDWVVYRYADVLLSLSEILVRRNNEVSSESLELLNRIRRRAGIKEIKTTDYASPEEFLDLLLLERGHEFWGEGHRRSDLIRFGKFVEYAKKYNKSTTVKDYMVLMPIPQDVITEGRGKVLQNPGYND